VANPPSLLLQTCPCLFDFDLDMNEKRENSKDHWTKFTINNILIDLTRRIKLNQSRCCDVAIININMKMTFHQYLLFNAQISN